LRKNYDLILKINGSSIFPMPECVKMIFDKPIFQNAPDLNDEFVKELFDNVDFATKITLTAFNLQK
jgi:hypothetical protein